MKKYRYQIRKLSTDKFIGLVGALITILILIFVTVHSVLTGHLIVGDLILTPDQQGQRLYSEGRYADAAERFEDPYWKAISLYKAGEFKQAANAFASLGSPEAMFNYGNALLMQGRYEPAIESYEDALRIRPGWEDAEINRAIAIARAEKLRKEGGDMTGGMMGADEISFEKGPSDGEGGEEIVEGEGMSEAELRSVWLRRVQTKPADFLKARFAYQNAVRDRRSND